MLSHNEATALVVVDVQNDFADPAGSLCVTGAESVIPSINAAVSRARDAGVTIVYTQDWHPETTPHFEKDGGIWPVHCVHDTWGAALHPSLVIAANSIRLRKGAGGEDGYSAFAVRDPVTGEERATQLQALLRDRSVGRVLICGLATDYCVRATALDAQRLGFETTVLTDAIGAVDLEPGDGQRALAEMAAAGVALRSVGA